MVGNKGVDAAATVDDVVCIICIVLLDGDPNNDTSGANVNRDNDFGRTSCRSPIHCFKMSASDNVRLQVSRTKLIAVSIVNAIVACSIPILFKRIHSNTFISDTAGGAQSASVCCNDSDGACFCCCTIVIVDDTN